MGVNEEQDQLLPRRAETSESSKKWSAAKVIIGVLAVSTIGIFMVARNTTTTTDEELGGLVSVTEDLYEDTEIEDLQAPYNLEYYPESAKELRTHFESWKVSMNKEFESDEEQRFREFVKTTKRITQHNKKYAAGLETHYMGLNEYSAMSMDEFEEHFQLNRDLDVEELPKFDNAMEALDEELNSEEVAAYESHLDYRTTGNPARKALVTPVKNQGRCGSCWTFSTIGSLEGSYCKAHSINCARWSGLSEQSVLSCSRAGSCRGGWPQSALYYIHYSMRGIETAASYPYTARDTRCSPKKKVWNTQRRPYYSPGTNAENIRKYMAAYGPASIALYASRWTWKDYAGGILSVSRYCPRGRVNHAVTTVGYGVSNGGKVWFVKNSWGARWGKAGYMYIPRGSNWCACERYVCMATGQKA